MKKFFCALVKLVTVLALLGALLYAAVTYWDKIMEFVAKVRSLLPCRDGGCVCAPAESDDYADWEM
ncbi:hypothetical protein [Flavonifractor hominis]|uniref:Cyclic lactone autoinducer peptide n=1 Tax=Flavonifractor hominis TaxID=3133178 RepID=A0ABV1EPA3_9FIRM